MDVDWTRHTCPDPRCPPCCPPCSLPAVLPTVLRAPSPASHTGSSSAPPPDSRPLRMAPFAVCSLGTSCLCRGPFPDPLRNHSSTLPDTSLYLYSVYYVSIAFYNLLRLSGSLFVTVVTVLPLWRCHRLGKNIKCEALTVGPHFTQLHS